MSCSGQPHRPNILQQWIIGGEPRFELTRENLLAKDVRGPPSSGRAPAALAVIPVHRAMATARTGHDGVQRGRRLPVRPEDPQMTVAAWREPAQGGATVNSSSPEMT